MRKRIYKHIARAVTYLSGFDLMISLSCLDSPDYRFSLTGILISVCWLLLVLYASTEWEPS